MLVAVFIFYFQPEYIKSVSPNVPNIGSKIATTNKQYVNTFFGYMSALLKALTMSVTEFEIKSPKQTIAKLPPKKNKGMAKNSACALAPPVNV
jgi:hypothetical protein